jgi:hypothetical protein
MHSTVLHHAFAVVADIIRTVLCAAGLRTMTSQQLS